MDRPYTYMDRVNERKLVEEAEDVDLTASIHGNWTIDNAKSRLNMFFQVHKMPIPDYKYTPVGPDHNKYVLSRQCVWFTTTSCSKVVFLLFSQSVFYHSLIVQRTSYVIIIIIYISYSAR